jgi:hypothetical protein
VALIGSEHRQYLEERYNVRAWLGKSRYAQTPIRQFAVETLHLSGWKQHRVWRVTNPAGIGLILRQHDNVLEQIMAINVWECADVEAAHEYLLAALMQAQSTAIERDRVSEIGDVLFRLNDTFFVFARANIVVLVRNIGSHVLGIEELANTLDLAILRRLALGPQAPVGAPAPAAAVTTPVDEPADAVRAPAPPIPPVSAHKRSARE